MDLIENQKSRRKRGVTVIVLAMLLLMTAIRQASVHQVRAAEFVLVYFSGAPLGAGLAMIVASHKVMREIAGR